MAAAWASRGLIDFTVRIFIGASPEVGASLEAARTAGACSGQCSNDFEIMPLELAEERDHVGFFTGAIPLAKAGPFGYTVRALPYNDLLANLAETGLVATAS